ncbi:uncharacterized protein LOC136042120 isoform X2 [Artemia franciscana]
MPKFFAVLLKHLLFACLTTNSVAKAIVDLHKNSKVEGERQNRILRYYDDGTVYQDYGYDPISQNVAESRSDQPGLTPLQMAAERSDFFSDPMMMDEWLNPGFKAIKTLSILSVIFVSVSLLSLLDYVIGQPILKGVMKLLQIEDETPEPPNLPNILDGFSSLSNLLKKLKNLINALGQNPQALVQPNVLESFFSLSNVLGKLKNLINASGLVQIVTPSLNSTGLSFVTPQGSNLNETYTLSSVPIQENITSPGLEINYPLQPGLTINSGIIDMVHQVQEGIANFSEKLSNAGVEIPAVESPDTSTEPQLESPSWLNWLVGEDNEDKQDQTTTQSSKLSWTEWLVSDNKSLNQNTLNALPKNFTNIGIEINYPLLPEVVINSGIFDLINQVQEGISNISEKLSNTGLKLFVTESPKTTTVSKLEDPSLLNVLVGQDGEGNQDQTTIQPSKPSWAEWLLGGNNLLGQNFKPIEENVTRPGLEINYPLLPGVAINSGVIDKFQEVQEGIANFSESLYNSGLEISATEAPETTTATVEEIPSWLNWLIGNDQDESQDETTTQVSKPTGISLPFIPNESSDQTPKPVDQASIVSTLDVKGPLATFLLDLQKFVRNESETTTARNTINLVGPSDLVIEAAVTQPPPVFQTGGLDLKLKPPLYPDIQLQQSNNSINLELKPGSAEPLLNTVVIPQQNTINLVQPSDSIEAVLGSSEKNVPLEPLVMPNLKLQQGDASINLDIKPGAGEISIYTEGQTEFEVATGNPLILKLADGTELTQNIDKENPVELEITAQPLSEVSNDGIVSNVEPLRVEVTKYPNILEALKDPQGAATYINNLLINEDGNSNEIANTISALLSEESFVNREDDEQGNDKDLVSEASRAAWYPLARNLLEALKKSSRSN